LEQLRRQVHQELIEIHRSRNRAGYLPHVVALGLSVFANFKWISRDFHWFFPPLIVVVGLILRALIGEIYFVEWSNRVKSVRVLNNISFFLIAIGWGIHFFDIGTHFGIHSPEVAYSLLITAAFVAGATTSLIGDPVSFYFFSITLSVFTTISLIYLSGWNIGHHVIMNVVFSVFCLQNYRLNQKKMSSLIEASYLSKKEKESLEKIINSVPGYVGLMDKNRRVYMANQTTLSLYPDIIGRKLGSIDPYSQWERLTLEFFDSDQTSMVTEATTVFSGEEIWALLNLHKTSDGGVIIVSIITTELVLAQRKIREQEVKAQYSAKLASLGEMAAGIAHEVNNPLTIIQGSAQLIKKMVHQDPLDVQNLQLLSEKIIDTTDRISKTVRSLKALSRNGENDKKESLLVDKLVSQSLDLCHQRFRNLGITLIKDIPENRAVCVREVQFCQVLVNLLNNAADAVKDHELPWVRIEMKDEDDYLAFYIIDSGKGIEDSIKERIMEPFFTTKEINHGTGLGLSISRAILKDHGGDLILVDAPNTTFKIILPKNEAERLS